jgi:RHS repeat-associated protein
VVQGDGDAPVMMTRDYAPYGEVLAGHGTNPTPYGFTGEWTDASGLIYLRARYYASMDGRFTSNDTWQGDNTTPMSYNAWLYGYSNPVKYVDPSGLSPLVSDIEIDDNFSQEEKTLISETISDYSQLLGGKESLRRNLALKRIVLGWTKSIRTRTVIMLNIILKITRLHYPMAGIVQLLHNPQMG